MVSKVCVAAQEAREAKEVKVQQVEPWVHMSTDLSGWPDLSPKNLSWRLNPAGFGVKIPTVPKLNL